MECGEYLGLCSLRLEPITFWSQFLRRVPISISNECYMTHPSTAVSQNKETTFYRPICLVVLNKYNKRYKNFKFGSFAYSGVRGNIHLPCTDTCRWIQVHSKHIWTTKLNVIRALFSFHTLVGSTSRRESTHYCMNKIVIVFNSIVKVLGVLLNEKKPFRFNLSLLQLNLRNNKLLL